MTEPAVIVVVGAGPRAVGFLERLGANVSDLRPDRPIEVHLVDPYPPGPGRVWRHAQSPLLRMNSMAEDVTMFTDDSVSCVGPIVPGPSLAQWARRRQNEEGLDDELGKELADELRTLTGQSFPTRRLQSRYLAWFFEHTVASLPANVRVRTHADRVVTLDGPAGGRQRVWLAERADPLVADVVVLALGHLDAEPTGETAELAEFARAHGLYYLPPAYSADVDLSSIHSGQSVLMRGFGLAFVDLMALLTEGRGGQFHAEQGGGLRYLPSGREPVLYVGSRRGVPYHAKIGYRLLAERPTLPRFFGAEQVDALLAEHESVDFAEHVWPLVAKDIGWGYYHELFQAHPDRVRMPWARFAERYLELDWESPALRRLIERSVPRVADRLDIERLDRPLDGLRFASSAALQEHIRDYVIADLARRADATYSADLGAFLALLSAYGQLPRVINSGKLRPASRMSRVEGWWRGFFSFFASGPPPDRLEQLLALSRAGVVRLLGADMWVRADAEHGRFVAGSASTDHKVTAQALVEARLPDATVVHSRDDLLRSVHRGGEVVEEILDDQTDERSYRTGLLRVNPTDGAVLDGHGQPYPNRFALGPFTTLRAAAAFARPQTNAPAFRFNDATARAVLRLL